MYFWKKRVESCLRMLAALAVSCQFFSCATKEALSETQPSSEAPAAVGGDSETQQPGPLEPGGDYISPDHFHLVRVELEACSDADAVPDASPAYLPGSKVSLAAREEALDETVALSGADPLTGGADDTKTALDGSNNILWNAGDRIKIYYTSGASNWTQGTVKHGGSADSTIDGWVNEEDAYYYAFYPVGITTSVTYDGDATYPHGAFTVTVPTEQDGAFANCHIAVGKASKSGRQFAFSNVGSYLKMEVADLEATSITVRSLVTTDRIAGTFTAAFADAAGTLGDISVDESSCSGEITVTLPSGRTQTTTVYVAVLPGATFSKGFLLRYNYSDGITRPSYVYENTSGRTVARRKILNCGSLDSRIVTDWFFRSDGTKTDPKTKGNGATWENALNATGLANLLEPETDPDLLLAQAARLDGAALHFAKGTFVTPSQITFEAAAYAEPVNLRLLGGYPTTLTGTSTSGRGTGDHETVLSGAGTHRIFKLGSQTAWSLDNFKMTGAYVTEGDGGCFMLDGTSPADCSLSLTEVWFYDNETVNQQDTRLGSGAAVCLGKGTLTAAGCTFEKGSGRNGGGIMVYYQTGANNAVANISDCLFTDNEAVSNCGGGFSANGGQVLLDRCTFTGNRSTIFGGAVHWDADISVSPSLTIRDCTFTSNVSDNGSGTDGQGGALSVQTGTVTLTGATFTGNRAGDDGALIGGAVWVQGTLDASDVTFTGNHACGDGGAICVSAAGSLTLSGTNRFEGNYCTSSVNAQGNTVHAWGGAICTRGTTQITGATTFYNNYTFKQAGAISFASGTLTIQNDGTARPLFDRNHTAISWSSGDGVAGVNGGAVGVYATSGTATLTGCDFDANYHPSDFINITSEGGAMAVVQNSATDLNLTVTDCNFTNTYSGTSTLNNYASATARNGGALVLEVAAANAGSISFSSCRFTDNRANNVGGVTTHKRGTVSFSDCTFTGNKAPGYSAVHHINNAAASASFSNCTMTGNQLTGTVGWQGEGVVSRIENGSVTMTSCTLSGNSAAGGSYGVIRLTGANAALTLRGCTVEGNSSASATADGGALYFGAGSLTVTSSDGTPSGTKSLIRANTGGSGRGYGLYVASGLTPSLSYCTFDAQNAAGAVSPTSGSAIYYAGETGSESLSMTGCEVKNFNRATNSGLWWTNLLDADSHTAASTLSFSACTFSGHTVSGNGGVFNYPYGTPFTLSSLDGCTFTGNSATGNGGAIYTERDIDATGCTFSSNTASGNGGALYMDMDVSGYGSGHEGFADHSVTSDGATFSGNGAVCGGAVYVASGRYFANGATYTSNTASHAEDSGGAVLVSGSASQATFDACSFTGNRADSGKGGALRQKEGVVKINACTFSGNYAAARGSCFYGTGWGFAYMNNSKFVGNSLGSGFGSAIFFSSFGWIFGHSLLVADNTATVNDSPVSGSGRLLLVNCTFLSKLRNAASGILRFENSYGRIYHSILLPTDDASCRYSLNLVSKRTGDYLQTYYSVLDGVSDTPSMYSGGSNDVSGKRPSDLGGWSWNATDKMYAWNGSVSGYTNYASLDALWTAVAASFVHYDAIPSPGGSPDYYFFQSAAEKDGGMAKTFLDWLDNDCGGRNKDILGQMRQDGKNYPGCRAF